MELKKFFYSGIITATSRTYVIVNQIKEDIADKNNYNEKGVYPIDKRKGIVVAETLEEADKILQQEMFKLTIEEIKKKLNIKK